MKKQYEAAIELNKVGKRYEIHHEKPTLVELITKGRNETFWALKNVNLTIYKGDRVGIIGPNGGGKTTLLKLIAGIATPTEGAITTFGRVVSLIDLEAGFQPDLTGIQNIFLNGMLLGMTKREISSRLTDIIAFADIKQFIDTPLRTYSQGMVLRLGFSVALHTDPDILLLDENMAVGDADFQRKSAIKLQEFLSKKKTLLIASHIMQIINTTCTKVIEINHGHVTIKKNIPKG